MGKGLGLMQFLAEGLIGSDCLLERYFWIWYPVNLLLDLFHLNIFHYRQITFMRL